VGFPIYMVALMVLFGWIFLVFFGGVGLVVLPLDLMFVYWDRPIKIELEEYAKLRLATKERAAALIEFGKTLEADLSGRAMTRDQKNMFNKFKNGSFKLDDDWKKINFQYNGTGPPLLYYQIVFGVGCAGAAVSALWILHLILYSVTAAATGKPVSAFLNTAFVGGDRVFPLVTVALFTIFSVWLLWAVLRGYTKIGMRVVSVPIHPLKRKGTYMNSLLFNTALVVCTALAVISFCAFNLDLYLRLTAADMIFTVMIRNLTGIAPAWNVLHILLFCVVAITGVYFFLRPREPSMENQLSEDLQEVSAQGWGWGGKGVLFALCIWLFWWIGIGGSFFFFFFETLIFKKKKKKKKKNCFFIYNPQMLHPTGKKKKRFGIF
jgi:LMBR1 domain-containing protein 1